MEENVCRFLPNFENDNFLNIINLVYETQSSSEVHMGISSTYRMHMITEGTGILHTRKGTFDLTKGDCVIVPPAKDYFLQNTKCLKYIYISFLGVRANILSQKFGFDKNVCLYHGYENILPMWQSAFKYGSEYAGIGCEGVILMTLSELSLELFPEQKTRKSDNVAHKIKKIIDDHFNESDLTPGKIADMLSYNPKYISTAFKREFDVHISNYITTLRIQHACTLIEQGLTSVKNISSLCGYNDPLYFSAIFKKKTGSSPKEHIMTLKK